MDTSATIDLSVLRLDTLNRIKADAADILDDGMAAPEQVFAAARLFLSVDAECQRRIEWVEATRAALAATK